MRIGNIQNLVNINAPQTQQKQRVQHPSFGAFERDVFVKQNSFLQRLSHRNNTYLFRTDLYWPGLIDYLVEKYKDVDKVNVYNYACSNGLEAYSFLMELFGRHDEETADKFTPIIAKDYDSFVINLANQRLVEITDEEKQRINNHTYGHFKDFFRKNSTIKDKYSPTEKLTSRVVFEVGDITKEFNDIKKDNTIVFARNFWPYLSPADRKWTLQKIAKQLGENSILIVGDYDDTCTYGDFELDEFLHKIGFKYPQAKISNVYEKVNSEKVGEIIDKKPMNLSEISFKSWQREVLTNNIMGTVKHRNDTWFYRGDPDWTKLTRFLAEKYKEAPKVNVYNWGCSNGSEAYTFLMEMFTNFKKDFVQKFMPVVALDYDPIAIEYCNLGEIIVDNREQDEINQRTKGNFDKYFSLVKPNRAADESWYAPKSILSDNVKFKEANILTDYEKMKKDNSVIFARNFWPYMRYNEKVKLAQNLYEHLGENSTIIIGKYDNKAWDAPTDTILRDAGFKKTELEYVYSK